MGCADVLAGAEGLLLSFLASSFASGELCRLLLRRRWRTLGGKGTSLRRGVPVVVAVVAFSTERNGMGDPRV